MSEPSGVPPRTIPPSSDFPIELYYEWIGRIASLWSLLENTIDETIWQLADVKDEPGACLTAQLAGIRPRLIVLEALVQLRGEDKDFIKQIASFTQKAQTTSERRNRAIHDAVLYIEPDSERREVARWRIIAQRKLDMGTVKPDLDWYRKVALEIGTLFEEYQTVEAKIFAKFPAYSRRPR